MPTYYGGFYYDVAVDFLDTYEWTVTDAAGTQMTFGTAVGYQNAVNAAKAWIDQQNTGDIGDIDYDDLDDNGNGNGNGNGDGGWDYGTLMGDDGNTYYWYITGKRLAIYRQEEAGEDTLVFEKSYPNTSVMDIYHKAIDWVYANAGVYKPPTTTDTVTGVENGGRADFLNVAGYWTLGVAQGTLFMLVPMVVVGMSVGFMQKVVKFGAGVGGD